MENKKHKLGSGEAAKRPSSPDEHTSSKSGKDFDFIEFIHSDLVQGDKRAILRKILTELEKQAAEEEASDNTDDSFILFEWNLTGLNSFLAKMDQLPASATPPPHALQEALHTAGDARPRMFMAGFLNMMKEETGCEVIDGSGGVAGISCKESYQLAQASVYLSAMDYSNKWFSEVLATGPPLADPLAALYMPTEFDGTAARIGGGNKGIESLHLRQGLWNQKQKLEPAGEEEQGSSISGEQTSSKSGKEFNFIEFIHTRSDLAKRDKQAIVGKIMTSLLKQAAEEEAADNPYDQFILFEWNLAGLNSFLAKVDQLPASATPPPYSLREVLHTAGDSRPRMLMAGILNMVKETTGCDVIDGNGGVAGISGKGVQVPQSTICLGGMDIHTKWFVEVLASGPPLEAPLATLHMPTSKGDGSTEQLNLKRVLWK
jgi:hypothetical protein